MVTVDFFLKMDGIPGESKDLKHKGEIDLESFSWAESNPSKPSAGRGGGSGAGKVAMHDFHFVTRVNKASPLLFLACATGKHIKDAVLTARKAGKGPLDYLIIKFKDVIVSSYQVGGSEAGTPMEQVSFNFARIDVEYREQKPDGTLASPIRAGWDVLKSKQT